LSRRATNHIIDDDPGMRRSLQSVLEAESLSAQVYESTQQFLAEADLESPGCIVLDVTMAGPSGADPMEHLDSDRELTPVIVISEHADVKSAVRSMKLGAIDVLQKPLEPAELVSAIRRAIERSGRVRRIRGETAVIRRRIQTLTQRERRLFRLVVAGHSNKQIAADLKISVKTVANHRAHLMAKTQAVNAADLARMCTAAGVV
jgi:two-component system response regulator FixJ